jgi:hypothetical protein
VATRRLRGVRAASFADFAHWGPASALALAVALASCAGGAAKGPSGAGGGGAGTGAAGSSTTGAGGGGSGAAGSVAGTNGGGGSGGDAGATGAAGTGSGAGVTGAAGGAGGSNAADASAGSTGEAGVDLGAETGAPCPGAGQSLHFEDDLKGVKTKSMQLQADLGADLPIGDAARTIELWLYMEGDESWKAEHSIIEYGGQGRCQAFGIDGGDNGTKDPAQFDPFTFSSGGPCAGDDNGNLSPAPPRTGWLHLAWVYDPAGKLSYGGMQNLNFLFTVNGVPQPIPAKKQTGALLTLKTLVSIGSGQITDNGFTGKMDELRFWNVARTPEEIAASYKLILKGNEPGLVAYYHFDDGAGTTAKDASSAHHDATFVTDGARPIPKWVDSTGLVLTCKP